MSTQNTQRPAEQHKTLRVVLDALFIVVCLIGIFAAFAGFVEIAIGTAVAAIGLHLVEGRIGGTPAERAKLKADMARIHGR